VEISGEQLIVAPRERVWEALNDPAVLKACILGCEELDKLSETEMKSTVLAKFGPVKAKFKADITIEDITVSNGVANIELLDDEQNTLLKYSVDFSVGGKIAQIGTRLLKGTTTKIVDHFFQTFPKQI